MIEVVDFIMVFGWGIFLMVWQILEQLQGVEYLSEEQECEDEDEHRGRPSKSFVSAPGNIWLFGST